MKLGNKHGATVEFLSLGARIHSVRVPDRNGHLANVVLNYGGIEDYKCDVLYLNCVVGRYANRIANGRFTLDGVEYQLPINDGPNHLHGGPRGFDKRYWDTEVLPSAVKFSLLSEDGDQGYPGNLNVDVVYTWTDESQLIVDYTATTDRATPINLTQHAYFNLAGTRDVRTHELRIDADEYLPVDETLIPTGVAPVAGTRFDFRKLRVVGEDYDHCFALRRDGTLKRAAELYAPESGRLLEVYTTEPGVQLYTGQYLIPLPNTALCLETQHYPDSPNQPAFPSTILRPDEVFRSQTVFKFGVK